MFVAGKCINKSDKSSPEESCTSTHSSSPSKISSCPSSIMNEHTVSQSSNERSSCALPNTSTESSFHSIKKQIHPIDVNISANDSSLRTPLRYRIKAKSTLPSSCNPACAFYTSMAQSFTSPCSSFDRWSSESFQDPTLESHLLYAQTSFSKKNIERRLPYRGDKKVVTGSSLRLPSQKIGFFDEVSCHMLLSCNDDLHFSNSMVNLFEYYHILSFSHSIDSKILQFQQ